MQLQPGPSKLTVAGDAGDAAAWVVNADIEAERLDLALDAWKRDLFARIVAGVQEDALLDKRRSQQGSLDELRSRAAATGDDLINGELRRGCIETANAPEISQPGGVVVKPPEEIGTARRRSWKRRRGVLRERILQSSFEWASLTYTLLPYYISAKTAWLDKLGNKSDLCSPGSSDLPDAVVRLPVARSHEDKIIHYISTGQIWNEPGAPLPADPWLLAILREVDSLEELDATPERGGRPVGDPWALQVPTGLVVLDDHEQSLPAPFPILDGRSIVEPSEAMCEGVPYDLAEWPDDLAVARALRALGYATPELTTVPEAEAFLDGRKGAAVIEAFQGRSTALDIPQELNIEKFPIDGKVGQCTLRVLSRAMLLNRIGLWANLLISASTCHERSEHDDGQRPGQSNVAPV